MVLIPLILNYGINTNAMEIARFALGTRKYSNEYHSDAFEQGDLRGVRVLRARGEGQSPLHHPYPYAPLPLLTRSNRNVRGHKGAGA